MVGCLGSHGYILFKYVTRHSQYVNNTLIFLSNFLSCSMHRETTLDVDDVDLSEIYVFDRFT